MPEQTEEEESPGQMEEEQAEKMKGEKWGLGIP